MYSEGRRAQPVDEAAIGLADVRERLLQDEWVRTAPDRLEKGQYAIESGYAHREVTVRLFLQNRSRNIGNPIQVWRGPGDVTWVDRVMIGIGSQTL